jgi:hypothetical protein
LLLDQQSYWVIIDSLDYFIGIMGAVVGWQAGSKLFSKGNLTRF